MNTMKKTYFIPKSTLLCMDCEEALLSKSDISEGEGDVFDTRKQESGNSLWDSWSN